MPTITHPPQVSLDKRPINASRYCAADATINPNTGAVTVGTDKGTELATAAQAAKDAGRPLYIPAGVYYSNVPIPMLPQIGVGGDGSAGQGYAARSTVVVFDLDNTTDGFTWTREGASGFGPSGYLRGMTIRAMTDRVSVRDPVGLNLMAHFSLDDLEVRGAARHNINIADCAAIRGGGIFSHRAKSSGLFIGGSSTTVRFTNGYFQETREGPGVDVTCIGASFDNCIFESNGRDVPLSGLGGALVRGGYVSFDGSCYWENNVGHDLWAGRDSATHLGLDTFHGLMGPDSDTTYAHVKLDQFVLSAVISPGKYDVRNGGSVLIHPLARGVEGAIGKGTADPVRMTDASDPTEALFGKLIGTDLATGELRTYGRHSPRLRDVHVSRHVRVANGTIDEVSVGPTGDPHTGLWFPAADRAALNAGGVNSVDVNTQQVRCVVPLRLPAYTTAQRDALGGVVDGFVILNTTIPAIQARVAGAWVNL